MIIGIRQFRPRNPEPDTGGAGLVILPDADALEDGMGGEGGQPGEPAAGAVKEDRGDDFVPTPEPTLTLAPAPAATAPAAAPVATPAPAGSAHVPISRFNEVNNERKQLMEENERLRASQAQPPAAPAPALETPPPPPAPAYDFAAKEREYTELLIDGDVEKAATLRMEISGQQEQAWAANYEQRQAQRQQAQSLDQAAAQAIVAYPYLDTDAGVVAQAAIVAQRDVYIRGGMTAGDALTKAVGEVAPKFAPTGQGTPSRELPSGTPAPDTRSTAAVQRGLQESVAQPPVANAAGAGNRAGGGEIPTEDLTEEQFDALTPQEKARRRGDF